MMDLRIPGSLKTEHEGLYEEMNRAARLGGHVGAAALLAFKTLQPHIRKEEEVAFPPLGLLPSLAEKGVTTELTGAIRLCDRMKSELRELLREHDIIRSALHEMNDAAMREQMPEYASLAKRLMHHLQMEEQVIYPACIMAGEYIRLSLYGPPARATR